MSHKAIATPASTMPESHGISSSRATHLGAGAPRDAREITSERAPARARTVNPKIPTRTTIASASGNLSVRPRAREERSMRAGVAGVDEDDDPACRVGRGVATGVEEVAGSGAGRLL